MFFVAIASLSILRAEDSFSQDSGQVVMTEMELTEYSKPIIVIWWEKEGFDRVFSTKKEAQMYGSGLEKVDQQRVQMPIYDAIALPPGVTVIFKDDKSIRNVAELRRKYPGLYKTMSEILAAEYIDKLKEEKKNKKKSGLWKRLKKSLTPRVKA
tara:strand:+ start:36679 stop:37140 length:462 start_codon:yes stop_codon:yes gene_type:complete